MVAAIETWQQILQRRIMGPAGVEDVCDIPHDRLRKIHNHFPIRISTPGVQTKSSEPDPVALQFMPDERELAQRGVADPLQEEKYRRADLIIHRYPNRALFLIANACASYCRFCTRRRQVGQAPFPRMTQVRSALAYIAEHREINEIILSGGDPLILSDDRLAGVLTQLRTMTHIRVIRVATRIFTALPQRLTPGLIKLLDRFQPLYVITQFNHANEFTQGCDQAVAKLIERGVPILNQSVLLAGINDDEETMLTLVQAMIERRIRPYYLHQLDPVQGAMHFEVPISRGREIMAFLRARIGGYAVPQYVYDDPNQTAKTLLYPESLGKG